MKKALITGITGQDGSYLADFLLNKNYEVHGLVRRSSSISTSRIDHLINDQNIFNNKLFIHDGDITDSSSLYRLIEKIIPDEIYNLAAQSDVKISFEIPQFTSEVNANSVGRILEAIREIKINTKFYQASSSEMFGKVQSIPQNENTPFYPRSPYGCSKLYAYWLTKNYRESYDMFTCNGILFNHESPRRGVNFVTRKITYGIAQILAKKATKIQLGNLSAKRDWGYAPDYVEAMWLMMQHNKADDYVIATNETNTVQEFLIEAFGYVNLDWKKYIQIDEKNLRPAEVDLLIGDYSKAKKNLKWEPKVRFKELVRIMVDADRKIFGC